MANSTKNQTQETTVELVHLNNGDIALRRADTPEKPMVVIRFSDTSLSLLAPDKMDIARAMVEAGIQRFGEIQVRQVEEAKEAAEQGLLHQHHQIESQEVAQLSTQGDQYVVCGNE